MQLKIEYSSLTNVIKEELKLFITNFTYFELTTEQIMFLINKSEKLQRICTLQTIDENLINKFHQELFKCIQEQTKESIINEDYQVILNYIDRHLRNAKGIIELIYQIDSLNTFFEAFQIDVTPELINTLLKSSNLLYDSIKRLHKHAEKHPNLKNQLSDFVSNLIETVLMFESETEKYEEDLDDEELKKIEKLAQKGDYYSNDFVHQLIVESHRYPLLTSEETNELIYQYRSGSKYAFEKLMLHNSRLVINTAKKHFGHGLERLDLIQEGNVGLVKGIERYNPDLGFKFSTYVLWWIKQSIRRALADNSRNIRIPVHMHEDEQVYAC